MDKKIRIRLSKELLGIIRSKYGSIPIPNSDTSLRWRYFKV